MSEIDPIYLEIGMRIRDVRREWRVTQGALAYLVGLEWPSSICDYEKGRMRIPIDILYAIAKALHCSVYTLLPEKEEQP